MKVEPLLYGDRKVYSVAGFNRGVADWLSRLPTLSGLVSFSPQFHTVFGRQYRVIKIHNNKARYVGAVTAKVVPKIDG